MHACMHACIHTFINIHTYMLFLAANKMNGQGNTTQSIYVSSRWNSSVSLCPWRVSEEWDNNEKHNSASAAADDNYDEVGLLFAKQSLECLLFGLGLFDFSGDFNPSSLILAAGAAWIVEHCWKLWGTAVIIGHNSSVCYGLLHFPRSQTSDKAGWEIPELKWELSGKLIRAFQQTMVTGHFPS